MKKEASNRIIALYKAGMSVKKICQITMISGSLISNAMRP